MARHGRVREQGDGGLWRLLDEHRVLTSAQAAATRRNGTTFYARPEELAAVAQRGSLSSSPLPWLAK